ncbi:hypothetical protein CJ030_MR8G028267 [Morella rubra]|uniref:Uncharacterized protein n=1 Tax=Morella rubra TaxID=262757 RepID=A0A6A1UVT9_9ROSI|nr:hypothetical protein CJ030_MR8G028267 [Morella rubra]
MANQKRAKNAERTHLLQLKTQSSQQNPDFPPFLLVLEPPIAATNKGRFPLDSSYERFRPSFRVIEELRNVFEKNAFGIFKWFDPQVWPVGWKWDHT